MKRIRTSGGHKIKLVIFIVLIIVGIGLTLIIFSPSNPSILNNGIESRKSLGLLNVTNEPSLFMDDKEDDGFVITSFPVCDERYSEIIPCLDRNFIYQTRLKLDLLFMEHYERHCPPPERRFNCLIPPPPGYKIPIKWPKSRDEIWKVNIPHTHLAIEKSDQNWMVVRGEKINFPGGGTHFPYGATKYIKAMADMLGFEDQKINNKGRIRTALDVGCGVASFGAYLLKFDVLTMSLAPNDVHQNQIQFALERGVPAYLGVLGTRRLPYPSRSFELAHCSRCRIDWLQRRGILLLELDRVLRPGGYFAYSSPEAYAHDDEDLRIWREMSNFADRMCWKIAAKRNQTVIWVKPLTNDCYMERPLGTQPLLCRSEDDPDLVSHVPMEPCITPYSDHDHRAGGSGLAAWPNRLITTPPRLDDFGYTPEMFNKDMEVWAIRVDEYWRILGPKIKADTLRNIMDMNANMGSFAAALKDKPVWVMNIVSDEGVNNTLKLIYDRGLIGVNHNWCESFSTYPRTYDLLHAWMTVSDVDSKGCSVEDLLIEMDRILRPKGFIVIRDKRSMVEQVKRELSALYWEEVGGVDSVPDVDEEDDVTAIVIQKKISDGYRQRD